jgi:hypothetical protein
LDLPDNDGTAKTKTHTFTATGAPIDRTIGVVITSDPSGSISPFVGLNQACINDPTASCNWSDNTYTYSHTWNSCAKIGTWTYQVTDLYGRHAQATFTTRAGTPILHMTPSSWTIPLTPEADAAAAQTIHYVFRLGRTHRSTDPTIDGIYGIRFPGGDTWLDLRSVGGDWDGSQCNTFVLDYFKHTSVYSGAYEYRAYDHRAGSANDLSYAAETTLNIIHNNSSSLKMLSSSSAAITRNTYLSTLQVRKPASGCIDITYVYKYFGERAARDPGVAGVANPSGVLEEPYYLDPLSTVDVWGNDDNTANRYSFPWQVCDTSELGYHTYRLYDVTGDYAEARLQILAP